MCGRQFSAFLRGVRPMPSLKDDRTLGVGGPAWFTGTWGCRAVYMCAVEEAWNH